MPRAVERARAKDVEPVPAESVPIAHRHAQMLFHRLAHNDARLVVVAIGERVGRFGSFVFDGGNVGEIAGGHHVFSVKRWFEF